MQASLTEDSRRLGLAKPTVGLGAPEERLDIARVKLEGIHTALRSPGVVFPFWEDRGAIGIERSGELLIAVLKLKPVRVEMKISLEPVDAKGLVPADLAIGRIIFNICQNMVARVSSRGQHGAIVRQ